MATIATAIGLFLAVSWLGLWLWLPPIGRIVALVGFAVLTAAACVPLLLVRFPSRTDGLRRLDRNSRRSSTGRRPRSATSLQRRWLIRGRPYCGAPMWNARCWRPVISRPVTLAASRIGAI